MSKLLDELPPFLGVGKTEQSTLAPRTLDKGFDKCLLMHIHMAIKGQTAWRFTPGL